MKVPISWLTEYLDLKMSPEGLAEVLTLAGIEVEGIEPTDIQFTGVVVGKIVKVERHPHADRLNVATVSDGTEEFQVVCGAPNCRAGIKTAFAKIGATLKDEEKKSFKIKKGKLRDVESFGMLCSDKELGLSDDHGGIMELCEEWAVGSDLAGYFSDVILDLSLTPNLGHCMSILGIARELSAQLNLPLLEKKSVLKEEGPAINSLIDVQLIDKKQCNRYALRAVMGVTVGPSPDWLKKKIEACGLRSVNNVVDVGNLVMLEMGQPLHLFDYDCIEGKKIVVTAQTAHKEMVTLDEALRLIPPEALLICDEKNPLAFAGVMGGKSSAVTDQTKNILIEAAYFTPEAIRKTCKWLGLKSDSSQRFEKGIDPNGVLRALDSAAVLLQQVAGGSIAKGAIDIATHAFSPKKINCRPARVNELLGTALSIGEIALLFQRLGMEILEEKNNLLLVAVPTYRNDITTEIDLVEEAARVYGYNNIPKTTPKHVTSPLFHAPIYLMEKEARKLLIGAGLQELVTCDLIHPEQASMAIENSMGKEALIPVMQAHSVDQSVLRASLLSGLLQVVSHNIAHGTPDVRGFEVGRIHFQEKGQYFEPSMAGIILAGKRTPYHWDPKTQQADFFDLKGIVENFFDALRVPDIAFEVSHLHNFHPGRQVRIKKGAISLGVMGEVHPQHLKLLGIEERVYFAEINLNELLPLLPKQCKVAELPQFPGSERDWTIPLEEEVPIGLILDTVRSVPSRLLEKITLLDLYKSDQIGKNRKNATFRFFYRDREKTIAFETVEHEHARITQAVAEKIKTG